MTALNASDARLANLPHPFVIGDRLAHSYSSSGLTCSIQEGKRTSLDALIT